LHLTAKTVNAFLPDFFAIYTVLPYVTKIWKITYMDACKIIRISEFSGLVFRAENYYKIFIKNFLLILRMTGITFTKEEKDKLNESNKPCRGDYCSLSTCAIMCTTCLMIFSHTKIAPCLHCISLHSIAVVMEITHSACVLPCTFCGYCKHHPQSKITQISASIFFDNNGVLVR